MKTKHSKITYVFIAVLFFAFGFLLNKHLEEKKRSLNQANLDMELFWETWSLLEEKYPFEEPESHEKLHGAISGLVSSYKDPHMAFFPPNKSKAFAEDIAGEFGGAGMEVTYQSGYVVVVSPLNGSAAERAGILPEDIITEIDGVKVTDFDFDTAISKIRGDIGTELNLTIFRQGVEGDMQISLTREIVKVPVLDTSVHDDVFVIHFYTFTEQSEDAFKKALIEFKQSGKKDLLIDLRNNPGGFLSSSIAVASYFLDEGLVIVEEDNGGDNVKYRSNGYGVLDDVGYRLSILLNNGSASASEIVAGALRDHGKARIYGKTSFGKGSVQELVSTPDETSVKITIAKWLTPDGVEISNQGIKPDVMFETDLLEKTLELLGKEE